MRRIKPRHPRHFQNLILEIIVSSNSVKRDTPLLQCMIRPCTCPTLQCRYVSEKHVPSFRNTHQSSTHYIAIFTSKTITFPTLAASISTPDRSGFTASNAVAHSLLPRLHTLRKKKVSPPKPRETLKKVTNEQRISNGTKPQCRSPQRHFASPVSLLDLKPQRHQTLAILKTGGSNLAFEKAGLHGNENGGSNLASEKGRFG